MTDLSRSLGCKTSGGRRPRCRFEGHRGNGRTSFVTASVERVASGRLVSINGDQIRRMKAVIGHVQGRTQNCNCFSLSFFFFFETKW